MRWQQRRALLLGQRQMIAFLERGQPSPLQRGMETSPPGAEVSSLKHNFINWHDDIVQWAFGSMASWMQL